MIKTVFGETKTKARKTNSHRRIIKIVYSFRLAIAVAIQIIAFSFIRKNDLWFPVSPTRVLYNIENIATHTPSYFVDLWLIFFICFGIVFAGERWIVWNMRLN